MGRAFLMGRRGIRVTSNGNHQSLPRRFGNSLNIAVPLIRSYEIVAFTWPLSFHLFPQSSHLDAVLIDFLPLKVLGVVLWCAALLIYSVTVWTMGASWRIGIDHGTDCPLITNGIFTWTRNPIYLSFGFMAVGTFCILGRLVFLLLALASLALLHIQVRQEERFLIHAHGESYRHYYSRVGRYLRWF